METTVTRRTVLLAVSAAVVVLAAVGTAFLLTGRETPADARPAASPTAAAGVPVMVDGRDYFVGTNIDPGVYRQRTATAACVWKVTDPITGQVIEESLAGAPGPITVNLASDTRFRSDGCGAWVHAG